MQLTRGVTEGCVRVNDLLQVPGFELTGAALLGQNTKDGSGLTVTNTLVEAHAPEGTSVTVTV